MRVQRASTGDTVQLHERDLLGAGGEARIYTLPNDPSLVAKIWHKPTEERSRKLRVMLANPPIDPMANQDHSAIAWPIDLLHPPGRPKTIVGFVMPRVVGMRPIAEFTNPKTRRERCPLFSYFYLHRTARNLAIAVRALHERGYVIGDLNESNVLVAETALVTIVDTDSFQVWDAEAGVMYRCRVGKPEFTPPELQGKSFAQVDREPTHDRFGLGVLIFQLLQEGTHPFAGIFAGKGEPPPYEQRIAAGHFPHGGDPTVPYRPAPTALAFGTLFPGLANLFTRCFQDGHFRPSLRPDPQTWQWLLEEAESHLVTCWWNPQHVYGDHIDQCPWCSRSQLLGGRDPFPSADAVRRGTHLRPPRRSAAPPSHAASAPRPSSGPSPVPTPPPIPPPSTRGSRRKPRPLLGDWNDWAWVGLALGGLAAAAAVAFRFRANAGTFIFAIFALLAGIIGEAKSRWPDIDGRGKWIARIAIVLGLSGLSWCLYLSG